MNFEGIVNALKAAKQKAEGVIMQDWNPGVILGEKLYDYQHRNDSPSVMGTSTGVRMPSITPTPTARPMPSPTPTPIRAVPMPTPTLLPDAPPNPYYDLLPKYFSPEEVNNASNVMFRESGYRPMAYNINDEGSRRSGTAADMDELRQILADYKSVDVGPYQINSFWQRNNLPKYGYTIEDMTDPESAINFASIIHKQQGWNPWYAADALGITNRQ